MIFMTFNKHLFYNTPRIQESLVGLCYCSHLHWTKNVTNKIRKYTCSDIFNHKFGSCTIFVFLELCLNTFLYFLYFPDKSNKIICYICSRCNNKNVLILHICGYFIIVRPCTGDSICF